MKRTREAFLFAVQVLEGTPYIWGGKKPPGLDCSGLVTYALRVMGGPDLRQTHNSQRLFDELPKVELPQPGDLAFYGPAGKVNHVVICLPGGSIIGANGGNSSTNTLDIAQKLRACVKRKSTVNYRPDLVGYRSTSTWWKP